MAKKATAKTSSNRSTPKVSPVKGNTVAWYVGTLKDWRGDVVKQLDQLVMKAVPGATSSIKWAQPVYESGGPVCFVKAAKNHVTFGFWRGTEIDDPKMLLEGSGDKMRHVKIKDAESIPTSDLRKMIKQAVKLNKTHGNPTK